MLSQVLKEYIFKEAGFITGELINALKKIAVDANEASDPVRLMFGIVTKTEPLTIMVDQRLILDESKIVLCSSVVERTVKETFNMDTESTNSYTLHSHRITGQKSVTLNFGLKEGEKVILLRMQGGQSFLVLDRVVE